MIVFKENELVKVVKACSDWHAWNPDEMTKSVGQVHKVMSVDDEDHSKIYKLDNGYWYPQEALGEPDAEVEKVMSKFVVGDRVRVVEKCDKWSNWVSNMDKMVGNVYEVTQVAKEESPDEYGRRYKLDRAYWFPQRALAKDDVDGTVFYCSEHGETVIHKREQLSRDYEEYELMCGCHYVLEDGVVRRVDE